jgi:hypothetical protein
VINPGDPSHAPLTRSNFDPGHRINLAASYQIPTGPVRTTLSAFYNGQSGRPFAYRFANDVNGDQGTTNDLLYIPTGADDVIVTNGTFDQLMAFLEGEGCPSLPRGSIQVRNACRSPWTNQLDFRAGVDLPVRAFDAEITFDILNVLNLLNKEWGVVEYAGFNGLGVANGSVDPATGKWVYSLATVTQPGQARFTRDDLRSRAQAQLGLRVRF